MKQNGRNGGTELQVYHCRHLLYGDVKEPFEPNLPEQIVQKIDVDKLKDPKKREEYTERVKERIQEEDLEEMTAGDAEKKIAEIVSACAREVLGERRVTINGKRLSRES